MPKSRRNEIFVALVLVAPFVAIYGWLFYLPDHSDGGAELYRRTTDRRGQMGGHRKLCPADLRQRLFKTAIWNTSYFVILTVIPGTLVALLIALMVSRLKGWLQSVVLAAFFLPFILPVTVVYLIWHWIFDLQFGIIQYLIEPLWGQRVPVFRRLDWFMPAIALVTMWWTNGFSILLFLAGLRNISSELYEAAELDGAGRWPSLRKSPGR